MIITGCLCCEVWWWYTYNHEEFDKESDHEEFDKEIIDGDDHGHGGSVKVGLGITGHSRKCCFPLLLLG